MLRVRLSSEGGRKTQMLKSFVLSLIKVIRCTLVMVALIEMATIVGIAILILALIPLIVSRVFQFIRTGNDYLKLVEFKHLIRGVWFIFCPIVIEIGLWMVYPLVRYVPSLKEVMLLEMPLTKWFVLVSLLTGLCLLSSVFYTLVHDLLERFMGPRHSLGAGQACSEIVDSLVFWWAAHEVGKRIPSVKHHEILGLSTQQWIKVSVLVLIGYNLITLFTHIFVLLLHKLCQRILSPTRFGNDFKFWNILYHYFFVTLLRVKYLVYYANGMTMSISVLMSSLLLLLTWVFYFGSHLKMKTSASAKSIWEYGKWTFISLFIFSFLWFIKTLVLITWKARNVYERLQPQILSTSQQLYFLVILRNKWNFIEQEEDVAKDKRFIEHLTSINSKSTVFSFFQKMTKYSYNTLDAEIWKRSAKARKILQKDLLLIPEMADPDLDHLERATQYFGLPEYDLFLPAEQDWLTLGIKQRLWEETYVSDILKNFNQTGDNREILETLILNSGENPNPIDNATNKGQSIQEHTITMRKSSYSSDWNLFVKKLPKKYRNNPNVEIPFSEIQTWAERAYNDCLSLTNTLVSAKEVAECLNKIISWLLIAGIFILWLLLTGLASTKVFVLIASPLLAATFIFGESCKTLFQGILFVYVVHPIDVGDLCFIDDKMMEVNSIGVWTTTFTRVDKVGTAKDLVIYSNTELANKTIINYKTKFDWSDYAEFKLIPLKNTYSIQDQDDVIDFVERHLKGKCDFLSRSPDLTTLALKDCIKLVIRLEYDVEFNKEWTYYECVRLKDQLRGKFYLIMQDIVNKFETKFGKKEESQQARKVEETSHYELRTEKDHHEIEQVT